MTQNVTVPQIPDNYGISLFALLPSDPPPGYSAFHPY
jgi:hypothetical protein